MAESKHGSMHPRTPLILVLNPVAKCDPVPDGFRWRIAFYPQGSSGFFTSAFPGCLQEVAAGIREGSPVGRFAFTGFTLCEDCIDLDIQNAKGQVLYSSGRLVKLCLSGINVELTSSECDLRIAKT